MAEAPFAGLREYAADTARQPDFDSIRRRAVQVRKRRRHHASTVVAGLTAVVVAALAISIGPREGEHAAGPNPSATPSWDPNAGWPRWVDVEAAAADELYAVTQRCRTCEPLLRVSADGGRTWERRTIPPYDDRHALSRTMSVRALGPGVLLWTETLPVNINDLLSESASPGTADGRSAAELAWITIDGGKTWKRRGVDQQPVAAVPAGTRLVDCGAVKVELPCRFYAVDPATGRFAPLATQPTALSYESGWLGFQTDVPIGGALWVPGVDPATLKPAVAASTDSGRSWHTYVFPDGVPARTRSVGGLTVIAGAYVPALAAGSGTTAYVQLYHGDRERVPYRTTDGGVTWQPLTGGPLPETPDPGYMTSDGAHVVKTGTDFRASRNGGPYQPATLTGYPRKLRELTQVTSFEAAGRFVVTSGDDLYVSDDGWTWREVEMP